MFEKDYYWKQDLLRVKVREIKQKNKIKEKKLSGSCRGLIPLFITKILHI
jgi:hypothetical protein